MTEVGVVVVPPSSNLDIDEQVVSLGTFPDDVANAIATFYADEGWILAVRRVEVAE